ncbi:MAG: hypothetical protein HN650_15565 [Rhodospirillaceae bacterium]|nr:hypothetical protein [Rhodospirillaceae bacterium]
MSSQCQHFLKPVTCRCFDNVLGPSPHTRRRNPRLSPGGALHLITATLWKYAELKKRHRTPKKLVIGTWLHGGDMFTQSWAGDVDFGAEAALADSNGLKLRWGLIIT